MASAAKPPKHPNQLHKRQWQQLRKHLDEMKYSRKKLSKHNMDVSRLILQPLIIVFIARHFRYPMIHQTNFMYMAHIRDHSQDTAWHNEALISNTTHT